MNTKLDNITTQYRKFNANQALTEGQLNEFIDYFDDQDRLSRTRLSGVGIACGFKTMLTVPDGMEVKQVSINQQPLAYEYITIEQGAGVTTDGDLITLRNTDYEAEDEDETKTKTVSIELKSKNYKYYRVFTDNYSYPHFLRVSHKCVF